jgi:hypothetical protein
MPMAWRCPDCRTIIHHNESEGLPRLGERYRCHACRTDLLFNAETQRLVLPPLDGHDEEHARSPQHSRSLLASVDDSTSYRRAKAS